MGNPAKDGEQSLLCRFEGPVAIVTLNRPEARNAMNTLLMRAIIDIFDTIDAMDEIAAVVITGAGNTFCAGGDLKEISELSNSFWPLYDRSLSMPELHKRIRGSKKPVISAVNGAAIGGGCALAMAGDIVIASERAFFSYPEIVQGNLPGTVMVGLTRLIGQRAALDMVLTGRKVFAPEARELGMVNAVKPEETFWDDVMAYANGLGKLNPDVLRGTKSLFYKVCEADFNMALDIACDAGQMYRAAKMAAPKD